MAKKFSALCERMSPAVRLSQKMLAEVLHVK